MAATRLRARGEYSTNDDQWKIAVVSEKRAQERWKGTYAWMLGADADTIREMEQEMRQRKRVGRNARNKEQHSPAGLRDCSSSGSRSSSRSGSARSSSATRINAATRPKSRSLGRADANEAAVSSHEGVRRNSAYGRRGSSSRPTSSRPPSTVQPCWQSNPSSRTGSARRSRSTSGLRHATAAAHSPQTDHGPAPTHHRHDVRPSARHGERPRNPSAPSGSHPLQAARSQTKQQQQQQQQQSYFVNPRVPLRTSDTIGWAQRQHINTLTRPRRQYSKPWLNNASLPASQPSSTVSSLPSGPAPQARRAPQMRTVSRARARGAPSLLSASSSASSTMTVGEFEEKYLKSQGPPGTFVSTPFASVGIGLSAPVGDRQRAREEEILRQRRPILSHGSSGSGTPCHTSGHDSSTHASVSQASKRSAAATSSATTTTTTATRPLSSIRAIERTTNTYKRQRSGFRPDMI